MKRGWRVFLILTLMVSLFFLVSCSSNVPAGERPTDTAAALKQVYSGTQGVVTTILPDYPPALIYDQNELLALVEVKNKGNYNLQTQDCFISITGFDQYIIRGGFGAPRSCAENMGTLDGKNIYNIEGSSNQIEFASPSVALPQSVFEYNPLLSIITCYSYHTIANPSICVDPLFYQITSEQKTCKPTDVMMKGGQGGPVGVGYVGVDMVGSKAVFEINVRNYGTGRVLSPYADIRNCGQASLEYTDLDKVAYDVQLSGGSIIDCKPRDGFVRLINNQGKIICTFNIPGTSAYETPLLVDLDYSYIDSFTKGIKIIKTPE